MQAKLEGKEPIFTVVFILLVGVICYGIYTTLPEMIAHLDLQIVSLKKEITSKKRSELIKQYESNYRKLYEPYERNIDNTNFKPAPSLMDDIKFAANRNNLEIVNLSRSRTSGETWVNRFTGVKTVEINLTLKGEFQDVLIFMNSFAENGPYRRVQRFAATSPNAVSGSKYTMVLTFPVGYTQLTKSP